MHAVAVRVVGVDVPVDRDRRQVRVLDVERRPLGDVGLESGHLAGVEPVGLVLAFLQDGAFVLAHAGNVKKCF